MYISRDGKESLHVVPLIERILVKRGYSTRICIKMVSMESSRDGEEDNMLKFLLGKGLGLIWKEKKQEEEE